MTLGLLYNESITPMDGTSSTAYIQYKTGARSPAAHSVWTDTQQQVPAYMHGPRYACTPLHVIAPGYSMYLLIMI